MNSYKKIILALGIALVTVPHISNALDAKGEAIKKQVRTAVTQIEGPLGSERPIGLAPRIDLVRTTWTPLLNGAVKTYIEDNSKVLGIKDAGIMESLQGILSLNSYLSKIIDNIENSHNKKQKITLGTFSSQMNTVDEQTIRIRVKVGAVKYQGITGRANAQEMLLIALEAIIFIQRAANSFAVTNMLLQK